MKLVDILARELTAWPETTRLAQDSNGHVFGWTGFPKWYGDQWITDVGASMDKCRPGEMDLAGDHMTSSVSRSEWLAAVDALNQSELDAVLAKNEQLAAARAERIPVWNGEGLPLVGLDVEIKRGNCTWIDGDEWQIGKTATVMASFLNSRDIEMASVQFPGGHCECILARCLSPIRTAEQVAAEEREKAINEMMMHGVDAGDSTIEYSCAALYDAGYRKEPKPCGS